MSAFSAKTRRAITGALLAAALLAFSWPALSRPAGAVPEIHIGINRLNLAWLSRSEQERVLNEIAASGATAVRLSLSRPIDGSIEALAIAGKLGLGILLEIQLSNGSYYPATVSPRSGFGRIWDIHRLSDLDLDRYRAALREALRRIDARGIGLQAIEPGNEINYAAYNGDLAVHRTPGRRTPRRIADLSDRTTFERGMGTYVRVLEITQAEVRATVHSRDAAVISAGLSDMSAREADRRGMERLDPGEVIALLREQGVDRFIDAYGIHVYPGRAPAAALRQQVAKLLDFCRPADSGKPCWVTEWGIANADRSCPVDDRRREGAIRAMRGAFAKLVAKGKLMAAFYYDWDTQPAYSLWRCGGLTSAGAAAIGRLDIDGERVK